MKKLRTRNDANQTPTESRTLKIFSDKKEDKRINIQHPLGCLTLFTRKDLDICFLTFD